MSTYTNTLDKSTSSQKSPTLQRKSVSITNAMRGVERPGSPPRSASPPNPASRGLRVSTGPMSKMSEASTRGDKTITQRFSNSSFNRVSSPRGRFQAFASAASKPPTGDRRQNNTPGASYVRVQTSSIKPRPLLKKSCTDIISKKRTLEMECSKSNIQTEVNLKPRPKTSNCSRTESSLDNKVLDTVQNVLSRAVLLQGKIDETNIDKIIESMRNSLNLEKNVNEEELTDINLEMKPSRTTINGINVLKERSSDKKSWTKPVAGIVRKDNIVYKSEPTPYLKIYDSKESPSKPTIAKNFSEGDDETYVYVDLPDFDPNFPSLSKNKGDVKTRVLSNNEINDSKQSLQENLKIDGSLRQFEVSDFQKGENHSWNSSEDAKLCVYIESLIKNMKCQMGNDNSVTKTDGEIDSQGTHCRSFCVCKVCVSKNDIALNQKSSSQKSKPLGIVREKTKILDGKQINGGKSKLTMQEGTHYQRRILQPSSKHVQTDSQSKVMKKTNPNFKLESPQNTSLHASKVTSFTAVETGNNQEDSDDMYLQRRIRRSPSRKSSAMIK